MLRRRMNVIMTRWQRLINIARKPYRPELHYMRGPGPKWHAKRRRSAVRPAASPTGAGAPDCPPIPPAKP
jgi:hypothetical protein